MSSTIYLHGITGWSAAGSSLSAALADYNRKVTLGFKFLDKTQRAYYYSNTNYNTNVFCLLQDIKLFLSSKEKRPT